MSIPRALLLILALLQAAGITDVMRRAACEEECRRDGCGDTCPPDRDCPQRACHCPAAASLAQAAISVTIAPIVDVTRVSFARSDARHASPDPRDILHVPRSRLA